MKTAALVVIIILVVVAALLFWMYDGPQRVRDWIKDHCQWYRRRRGGRWGRWNGFWEQDDGSGYLTFRRGYGGIDLAECEAVYEYRATMSIHAPEITAREDWTS